MAGLFGALSGLLAGIIVALIGRDIATSRPQPGAKSWRRRQAHETTAADRGRALEALREGYERGEIDAQSYERFFDQIRRSGMS